MSKTKRYLGDGVYACYAGFTVKLTAENGEEATDTIFLEPGVYRALQAYVRDVQNGRWGREPSEQLEKSNERRCGLCHDVYDKNDAWGRYLCPGCMDKVTAESLRERFRTVG